MSVQKYTINKLNGNFTNIPNKVLQELKDVTALGLYCYIASLPHGWEFHKSQLREHFNIGIHKLNSVLKLLASCNLIRIAQNRLENGQFDGFVMDVLDGSSFKYNELDELSTPFYNNRNTVSVRTVISTYKGNTYKGNSNKLATPFFKQDKSKNKKPDKMMLNEAKAIREHEERKKFEWNDEIRTKGMQHVRDIKNNLKGIIRC